MARFNRLRLKSAPTAGRSIRAATATDDTMVRSRPTASWVAANRLARSVSAAMSTVSSKAELNRLTDGASP